MIALSPDRALAHAVHHHSLSGAGTSIDGIVAKIVGLHNTSQATPYLSLRARLPGFAHRDLDDEMWGRWTLVRLRAMRGTMFVLPHDLLEITAAATRHFTEPFAARWLRGSGLSQSDFDGLVELIYAALADGPKTVRALRTALEVDKTIDVPGVVGRMCDMGMLVGGRPPGHWRSGVRQYHRWQDVLPTVDLHRWTEADAISELIERYICSYGPVTLIDISWWTGISKGRCSAALSKLTDEIQEVVVDGWVGPLYRHGECETGGKAQQGVKALPLLDPYVQGYRDRSRFLEPDRHAFVYDGGGNSTATLVDRGRIIGVWQVATEPVDSIRYHVFAQVPASLLRNAEVELEAAGEMYFDKPVDVIEVPTMKPLSADGGRSAVHPLDDRIHRASRRRPSPT